jgi:solute carrier family 13 (sodium-dependent dicarboxylate transporter), member 2/3/5
MMVAVLFVVIRPQLTGAGGSATEMAPAAEWVWTRERRLAIGIFILTVTGWVFGEPLGRWIGIGQDMDTVVALGAIALLGISGVLEWQDVERQTQWGVLLLFGGGLALSQVMSVTGASTFLAQGLMNGVAGAPQWLVVLALVAFVVMLTELVSNTASAALIVPIVIGLAPVLGMGADSLAVAVAISASCAFMLPVATPPNAIVFGSGMVPQRAMMRSGLVLNLVVMAVITVAVLWWV